MAYWAFTQDYFLLEGKKKNQDKKWLLLLVLGLLLALMALISLRIPVSSQKVPPPTTAAKPVS